MNRLMFVRSDHCWTNQLWRVQEYITEELACFHCGDACGSGHALFDGRNFCCEGCKAVYGLLQESGLCDYYELADRPGVKEDSEPTSVRSELFDLSEVRNKLVEFSEDGITRVTFHVPQMHCSSCIWLLENLYRLEPAIIRSRVRFTSKELSVTFHEDRFGLRKLVDLMRRIGYAPVVGGTYERGTKEANGASRIDILKIGVAGFAFGNIMLFSFPEYLGANTSDPDMMTGFQFLNFIFSLPVLFFSSTGFFRSAFAGLRIRTVNIDVPIALGIVALFSRSMWDVLTGAGPGYFDSFAGLVFFLLLGRWYQAYTYRAMSFDRTLNDFLPLVVLRLVDDKETPARVSELVPGDRIVVRDQELIPVDTVLLSGVANIDNSFITGEQLPVRRSSGDTIHAGGRQRGAAIELEVLRNFQESRLKRLWEENAGLDGVERPFMPRLIDGVARRFTIAVILLAAAAGVYWAGRDAQMVWPVVTSVLIVACPCALALSVPFAFGHAMRSLGRKGLFLRDSDVVERMARVDTVVFDKTGTLTAREAYEMQFVGASLRSEEVHAVRSLARNSTHPLSAVLYERLPGGWSDVIEVEEIPGQGIKGIVNGSTVRIGSVNFTGGSRGAREPGEAHVHVTLGGSYRGFYTMRKRARSGMAAAVEGMRNRAHTWLLTGDATIDPDVQRVFALDEVRTNCTPHDKTTFVRGLQQQGKHVLMVGDGLNDAAALQQSDVGISVCETSAALTPASDAILDARSIHWLPWAVRLTRSARRVVLASLAISLCYNVVGVSFAVVGKLTPLFAAVLMPLSSVTVVVFVSLAIGAAARRSAKGLKADECHEPG